jgi:hypothetical protein
MNENVHHVHVCTQDGTSAPQVDCEYGPSMVRLLIVVVAAFLYALPAAASGATVYGGQMNISTGARLFDDTSILQYAAPRHVRTRIDGTPQTAGMGVNTLCCRTDWQLLHDTNRYGGPAVMLSRPLTPGERRSYVGRLLWIDGDVLVAKAGDERCTSGMTLAQARALLEHAVPASKRIYAPSSPFDGEREVLFGIPAKNTTDPAYGKGVRIVEEQSAITAAASDPAATAAVAWSGARAALATGTVCQIPIGGVTATEATLRSRQYPVSIHATFVVSRRHPFGAPWVRRWYLHEYVPSAKTKELLRTARGRNRLLP